MSTLVTLPRSSLSALSVGTLKKILWEARVRVPPGVVEKEELVERVWVLIEEEKRKDDEGVEDIGFGMDDMEGVEEPDREEEVVVEMVDPASEAHPDIAHEHAQGPTADRVAHSHDGHSETHEHLSVPAMDPGLASSRPTTPQLSTSPPNSTSPAAKFKPRPHPKPTSVERSGLCVVCQDEEACIAIVDCGYVVHVLLLHLSVDWSYRSHLALCRACSDLILSSSRECPLCRTRIVTEARLLRIFKT